MQLNAYNALRTGQMNSMCPGYANIARKGPQFIHETFSPSRRETYVNDHNINELVLSSSNIRGRKERVLCLKKRNNRQYETITNNLHKIMSVQIQFQYNYVNSMDASIHNL